MNKPIVVATGNKYTDIDSLACAIAYSELLWLQSKPAIVVLPGPLNISVPPMIQNLGCSFSMHCPADNNGFIIVDVSDPRFLLRDSHGKQILEIYDHHAGFEEHWQQTIGKEHTHIEFIGACATLIWEQYKQLSLNTKISTVSANLLLVAIFSNTLNFGSKITDDRDRRAYEELLPYTTLGNDWQSEYYCQVEEVLLRNIESTLQDDTKVVVAPFAAEHIAITQCELWDSSSAFDQLIEAAEVIRNNNPSTYYLLTSPSIRDKVTYWYTPYAQLQKIMERNFGVTFSNNRAVYPALILRKEIIKKFLSI